MPLSTKQMQALLFTNWMFIIAYNNFREMHNSVIRLRLRFNLQEAICPLGDPSHFFFPTEQVRPVCLDTGWITQLVRWIDFTKMIRMWNWGWRDGSVWRVLAMQGWRLQFDPQAVGWVLGQWEVLSGFYTYDMYTQKHRGMDTYTNHPISC